MIVTVSVFAAASCMQASDCMAQASDTTSVAPDSGLQEVVVTATKRKENIQDVPLAITALSGKDLADVGAESAFDLQGYVPGLRVESAGGLAQPRFNLRGLGTDEYTPNANGSVGVYVDEVYFDSTVAQALQMFDIDQVEVLKGPQGTLWGKNTTGGAINFTPSAPTNQFEAYANSTVGSFDSTIVQAAVSGPLIGDTLLGRVSFLYDDFGGYVRNTYLNTIDNGHSESAVRLQLLWNLTDSGTLRLTLHDGKLDQVVPTSHAGYFADGLDDNGIGTNNDRYQVAEDGRGLSSVDSSGGLLKFDWGFPDQWHLTDLLALEQNSFYLLDDDDATPLVISNEGMFSSTEQISNEVRLASPATGPVTGIFGAYWLHDDLSFRYALPQFDTNSQSDLTTKDYAVFASTTIKFLDRFTGRLGVRYTDEQKSINQTGDFYTPSSIDQYNVNLSTTPLVPFLNYDDSRRWDQATGDASLDYHIDQNAMVYARVAKGFRGGNYNTAIQGPNEQGAVNPETLIDYEVGTKIQGMNGHVTVDASAFDYDYRDLQVFLLQETGAKLENAAKARIDGAELEISATPTDAFLVRLSGSYIHARYTSFPDASVPYPLTAGAPIDLTGQPLERAPTGTADLLLRYTVPLGADKLSFQTDWNYTGKVIFAPWVGSPNVHPVPSLAPYISNVFNLTTQDPVTVGNARITWTRADDRFEVSAWVKNLTNAQYKTNMYNLFFNGNAGIYWNAPTTFGVTVSMRFPAH